MFRSSKLSLEPKFCERCSCSWQKMTRNADKMAQLIGCAFHFETEFRSKGAVQSEVQFEVQIYCLCWYFQICCQKIVGKGLFYNIWIQ